MNLKQTLLTVTAAAGLFGATTLSANADTVTVKAGDTVSAIAKANKTSVSAIKAANSLKNVNLIFVGQKLEVGTVANQQTSTQNVQPQAQLQVQPQSQQVSYSQPQSQPAVQTTQTTTTTTSTTTSNSSESAAKAAIAARESGGSYTATNGQFYGKYQLSRSMLNGDLSAANQEKAADNYANSRYGSWANALQHSNEYGWY